MSKILLGKIEVLDPRTVWQSEEKDFTPWLAEHINALSEAIGIPIIIEQIEKKVGQYELDILGKVEGSDKIVVIENQLDPSDHKHLGQLITYASGLDASVIIWITPQIRDEHKQAIEWLNNIGGDEISFFLIRPEVIRIDDSKPAIRFEIESGPSEFVEGLRKIVEDEDAPRHIFRKMFWAEMFEYLAQNGHPWANGRRTTKEPWINSSVGKSGISASVSMAQGSRLRLGIELYHQAAEQNIACFKILESHKIDIEDQLKPEQVSWETFEGQSTCRIAVYLPYDKEKAESDGEYRKTLFPWIAKNLTIMRKVAKQYLIE
jgi:hypothetical protein